MLDVILMNEEVAARFPTTRKRALTGLVVGIPYCSDHMAQAVVLWQSLRFKNSILIAIYDKTMGFEGEDNELGAPLSMIYTGAQLIRQGHWKILGETSTKYPVEISTRRVAANIYIDDNPVREATTDDNAQYPNMLIVGGRAVENYIRYLFAIEEPAAMHIEIRAGMESLLNQYLTG